MKRLFDKFSVYGLFVVVLFLLYSCNTMNNGMMMGWTKHNAPYVSRNNAPPPHAPAWGYRAQHRYLYYPDAYVYFDLEKKIYFYLREGRWYMSPSLPSYYKVKLDRVVTIEAATDKPYIYFDKHRKKYPSKKWKVHKHGHNKKKF